MAEYFEPASTVFLCKVPWDSNYDDVVDWHIPFLYMNFFNNLPKDEITVLGSSAYMPLGMSICVDLPYERAREYNYCMVTNNMQVEGDKVYTLYYFITGADYNNPSSTTLRLSLDVWTTRYKEINVDIGYVERSSCALVNSPLVQAENKPLAWNRYCTMSDGVSSGDMYYTYHVDNVSLQRTESEYAGDYISIVSTASLTDDPGTVDSPSLKTAAGGIMDGVMSGCDVYFVKDEDFDGLMKALSEYPWVSQCIISISCVPSLIVNDTVLTSGKLFGTNVKIYKLSSLHNERWTEGKPPHLNYEIDVSKLNDDSRFNDVTLPYRALDKLYCYPYSVIELTFTASGQSVFLKPECLGGNKVALDYISCAIQPFASIAVFPESYGNFNDGSFDVLFSPPTSYGTLRKTIPYGELTNCALWLDDFPQWSIVNNAYIAYMASNANTRSYLYDSAAWTLRRSNASANTVYTNSVLEANAGYSNAKNEMNVAAMNYAWENRKNILTAGASSVNAAVSSGIAASTRKLGNVSQALTNAASDVSAAFMNVVSANEINQAGFTSMQNIAATNLNTSLNVASNNIALANYVNSGDYDMQVRGIDASYTDAALTQPSQSGSMGGNALRYSNGLFYNLEIRYKTLSDDAIVRNGDYFYRFGYTVNRYMAIPDRLVTNLYYSYWKIQQLNIATSKCNENEKDVIRGIFSKGVTVWKDPSKIAKILPRDNKPDPSRIAEYYV